MSYLFKDGVLEVLNKKVVIPNVKLIEQIGKETNAVVFLGKNEITNRKVAVKVWLPRKGFKFPDKDRFLAEVRKNSKFNSNKIVQVYNAGIINDNYFMEMEYVEGKTLKKWLNSERELAFRYRILNEILDTMEIVHKNAIYHGDLHYKNIIVDLDYNIKIFDFGTSIFCQSPQDSHKREGRLLFQTGMQLLYEEKRYLFWDIDPNKWPPECVRMGLKALNEIIWLLENGGHIEKIEFNQKEMISHIFVYLIGAPFLNIDNIVQCLLNRRFSLKMIGLLYDLLEKGCASKFDNNENYSFKMQIPSQDKIEVANANYLKWRIKCAQNFSSVEI